MDEELEFILDRVTRHDQDRNGQKEQMERWRRMWKLDPGFTRPLKEALQKGFEQVILPTPYNTVNMAQRLLSSTPRIDVIPQDIGDQESEKYAGQCEQWLTAMWKQINKQQSRNVIGRNTWHMLVDGVCVFEVKWVRENLPPLLRKKAFPIAIRDLDPLNCGQVMGPYGPEFAYHKYESTLLEVVRKWPDLKEAKTGTHLRNLLDQNSRNNQKNEDQIVNVVDYWAVDPEEGSVWNAVLVEDEFAKPYQVTTYPGIPLIFGYGDYGVGVGEEYDGLSILHSVDGLWQYQCRLASQMATGLYWYFWPQWLISNENNLPVPDFDVLPGGQEQVPPGTKVDKVTMEPNVPLAREVYDMLNTYVQQSTFPDQLFGQVPAELKTGYAVALLSEAAQSRIKNFQEGLEMAIMHVNEYVLALVEKKAGAKGVDIYGVDEVSNDKYRLTLSKKEIRGIYNNQVTITPAMPTDDLQKTVQGTQLANQKYISAQTLRDKYLGVKVPNDESRRIALEEAMQSDELRAYRMRTAMLEYFGEEEALTIIFTAGPEAEALMPPAPEGYEWTLKENGKVGLKRLPPPSPAPDMPLDPSLGGPMPPGGMPMDGGFGGPPSTGGLGPSGPLPTPPLQPPGIAGPMGGGVPPVMTGQFEGESLGLPQDVDPLLFDMLMNQQGGPTEVMNQTIGIQP